MIILVTDYRIWTVTEICIEISVLRSLLFIIYINNIIKVYREECHIKIFTGDMLIYVNGTK